MAYEGRHRLGDLFKSRRERGLPGLPTLSVTMNDGLVDRSSLDRKTDSALSDEEHLLVRAGDIAYNTMRMWQGASGMAHKDGLVSPAYVVLAPKAAIDSRFASYLFKSQRMIYLFWAYSYGLTADRLRLYYRDFARIPTTVPAIQEQKKFAAALVAWDKSIMVVEKMLKNLVRQRLGLFYGLLDGQFLQKPRRQTIKVPRLESATIDSQENKGSFPESVQPGIPRLQPTPRGWQRRCLGLYLSEVRRPVDLEQDRQYTLVTVKRSRGGVQQRSVLRGSEIKTATQFYIREGDFLISRRQIVHGACGIVPSELDGAIVSNEYIAFTANEGLNMRFLRYLSELKYFQQTCFHSSVGVHVEKMIFRAERWLRWPFNIPPICEQEGIAAILDDATAEVDAASRQLAALRKEKLALMQQILMSNGRATFDSVA